MRYWIAVGALEGRATRLVKSQSEHSYEESTYLPVQVVEIAKGSELR